MEAGAHRRNVHLASIFPQQCREGSFTSQGFDGSSRRRRRRFRAPAARAHSQLSLQSLYLPGIQKLSVSQDEFRAVLGRFPSGVTVVTTKGDDGSDNGMTVSAFCSVSLEPPIILICIEKSASAHRALTTAKGFVVNVLSAKQEQLARRFAIVDIDRFEGVGFTRSTRGYPILDDVLAVIECNRFSTYEGGDHTIILGE